jgi:hypothetical protein
MPFDCALANIVALIPPVVLHPTAQRAYIGKQDAATRSSNTLWYVVKEAALDGSPCTWDGKVRRPSPLTRTHRHRVSVRICSRTHYRVCPCALAMRPRPPCLHAGALAPLEL